MLAARGGGENLIVLPGASVEALHQNGLVVVCVSTRARALREAGVAL